jgi:AcrR family transcriptional regulator
MYTNRCKVTIVSTDVSEPARRRRRNPRGEGTRLRAEILEAAAAILEETGDEAAVTLRAIARAVGIAAPSIYAHFPDREAVLDRLVADGFAEFTATLQAAVGPLADPVERLYAGCRAYLAYAAERPERYRVLFHHPSVKSREREIDSAARAQGAAALDVLVQGIVQCARAGRSASADPFADAVAVWVALHGLATLLAETPDDFPWPDQEQMLTALVGRIARITPAAPDATRTPPPEATDP